jgi:hypothetical protein
MCQLDGRPPRHPHPATRAASRNPSRRSLFLLSLVTPLPELAAGKAARLARMAAVRPSLPRVWRHAQQPIDGLSPVRAAWISAGRTAMTAAAPTGALAAQGMTTGSSFACSLLQILSSAVASADCRSGTQAIRSGAQAARSGAQAAGSGQLAGRTVWPAVAAVAGAVMSHPVLRTKPDIHHM